MGRLAQMTVSVAHKGRRWILDDLQGGRSYVAEQDGTDREKAVFYENLSYMNLWNGLEDDTYLTSVRMRKGICSYCLTMAAGIRFPITM